MAQDAGLSRRKHGFEPRWDHQLFYLTMKVVLYIIEGIATCKRYVGITNDLQRRLQEHKHNHTKSGQIIGDFTLIYTEDFLDYSNAREREKFFKSGKGRQWIKDNIDKHGPPELVRLRSSG